jgi:hypothetical protein
MVKKTVLIILSGLCIITASLYITNSSFNWNQIRSQINNETKDLVQAELGDPPQVLGAKENSKISDAIMRVNIPAEFKKLLTLKDLVVEKTAEFTGEAEFKENVTIDGSLTLTNDVTGNDINLNLGDSGELTASNIVYSVSGGTGITVSGGQELVITNADQGSDQEIYKVFKVGDDTVTAENNTDQFEFKAGTDISLSLDTSDQALTITNTATPPWTSSDVVYLTDTTKNVGIGTILPTNTLEITSGIDDVAGLTFTNLDSGSAVGVGGGKVLSVNSGGEVILVNDDTGEAGSAEEVLPTADTGDLIYFNGVNWSTSTNFYHNGGAVGLSTDNPQGRLHLKTNAIDTIGLVIEKESSQTSNLTEWVGNGFTAGDTPLAYIDPSGAFHGDVVGDISGDLVGSVDPGLPEDQIIYQGPNGLTGSSNLVYSNGNVGIGTTAPTKTLDLDGTFSVNQEGGFNYVSFSNYNELADWRHMYFYIRRARGTKASPESINSGDYLGSFQWQAYDGNSFSTGAEIFARTEGTIGDGQIPTHLVFKTTNNSGSNSERMRLTADGDLTFGAGGTIHIDKILARNSGGLSLMDDSSNGLFIEDGGNIGIGTTEPGYKLEVDGWVNISDHTTGGFRIDNNWVQLYEENSHGKLYGYHGLEFETDASGVDKYISFNPAESEAMRISGDGSVGIGTTGPNSKLDVNGNITLKEGGTIGTSHQNAYFEATQWGVNMFYGNASAVKVDTDTTIINANGYDRNFRIKSQGDSGTQALFLDGDSGNIGIGTSLPSKKLEVVGDILSTGNNIEVDTSGHANLILDRGHDGLYSKIRFRTAGANKAHIGLDNDETDNLVFQTGSTSGGTTRMTLNEGGNVGLGTTSPNYKLDVQGTGALLNIKNSSGSYALRYNTASGHVGIMGNSILAYQNYFTSGGTDQTLKIQGASGSYVSVRGSTVSTDPDTILFGTSSSTERMRISSEGNVGIGTTSPEGKLDIKGTTNDGSTDILYLQDSDGAGVAVIDSNGRLGLNGASPGSNGLNVYGNIRTNANIYAGNSSNDSLVMAGGQFILNDGKIVNTNGGDGLSIDNSGNVGIGTTSPSSKLEVDGHVYPSSDESYNLGHTNQRWSNVITKNISVSGTIYAQYANAIKLGAANGQIYSEAGGIQINSNSGDTSSISLGTDNTTRFKIDDNGFVSLADDLDTYWDHPGSDEFSWTTSGSEAMRIDSSGNIGIGTTDPGYKLEVDGQVRLTNNNYIRWDNSGGGSGGFLNYQSDNDFYLYSSNGNFEIETGTGDTIFHSGNIGIGTTNPIGNFNIDGAATGKALTILNETGDQNIFTASSSGTPRFTIANDGNVGIGTTEAESAIKVSQKTSVLKWTENDSNTDAGELMGGANGGLLNLYDHGNPVVQLHSRNISYIEGTYGGLGIGTTNPGSAMLSVMNGNVGIGTTSPSEKLELNGRLKFTPDNGTIYGSDGDAGNIAVYGGSGHDQGAGYIVYGDSHASKAGEIWMYTSGFSETMVIDSSGNVGIGTTSPDELLTLSQSSDESGLKVYGYDDESSYWGTVAINSSGYFDFNANQGVEYSTNVHVGGDFLKIKDDKELIFGTGTDFTMFYDEASSDKFKMADHDDNVILAVTDQGNKSDFNFNSGNLFIKNDGNVGIGDAEPGSKLSIGSLGSSTGTNLVIDANGDVWQDSSSERYKTNISDISVDPEKLLGLEPVEFDYKETGAHGFGYVAEKVDALGLNDLVVYNQNGRPDAIRYDKFSVYLVEAFKDHTRKLQAMQKKIKENVFDKTVEFLSQIVVYGKTKLLGGIMVDKDTAGRAVIKAGAKKVAVDFDRKYEKKPVVNVTARSKANADFWVEQESRQGFVIKLAEPQANDLGFNWVALEVNDISTSVGETTESVEENTLENTSEQQSSSEPVESEEPVVGEETVTESTSSAEPVVSPTPSLSPDTEATGSAETTEE